MIPNLEAQYYQALANLLLARRAGNDESEILSRLDTLWYALDEDAAGRVNDVSARIARGEISEAVFVHSALTQLFAAFRTARSNAIFQAAPPTRKVYTGSNATSGELLYA